MANRRMFSLDVVNTDKFLEMPATTQLLYYHLGMRADDDGFVSSPRQIIRLVNCTNDDLRILISKGYVIPFETGVIVIADWKVNNYIRNDRYQPTRYQKEKQQLCVGNGIYSLNNFGIPGVNQTVYQMDTQDRLGKDSIGKDSIDNNICPEPENQSPDLSGILLPLNDKTTYNVPLSKIEIWTAAYPAVDVKQELLKMIAWLESNPVRRKTRRGITRFIDTWLSREQDKGGRHRQQSGSHDTADQRNQPPKRQREEPEYYKLLGKRSPRPDDPFQ